MEASGFVNLRNAESNPIAIAKLPLVEQIEPTFTDRASPQDATMELWDTLFAANGRAAFFLMQRFCHPSEGWGAGLGGEHSFDQRADTRLREGRRSLTGLTPAPATQSKQTQPCHDARRLVARQLPF